MKRILILGIFGSIIFSSCAYHIGTITGTTFPHQKIKGVAVGTSTTTYIFGIGGLDKLAMVYDAKKNLYDKFPLKENQAYSNFTVDFKTTLCFFYVQRKVILTADIVELP